jgi:transposase InsO family protein
VANERWSIAFVHDTLATGRKFRTLTIVDDFSRECVATEIDISFDSLRVIQVLQRLADSRGLPLTMKSDDGGEFTSDKMLKWGRRSQHRVALHRTRWSNAEQKRGKLQRSAKRRVFSTSMRFDDLPRPQGDRRMAARLQQSSTSQRSRRLDAERIPDRRHRWV